MPTSAKEFLSRRGLADLSLGWPLDKPVPQVHYPSSRTVPTLAELLEDYAEAARPSVPQQGQAHTLLEQLTLAGLGYLIGYCRAGTEMIQVKAEQVDAVVKAALAASRSEQATPHVCKLESFMGYSLTELVAIINQHKQTGAPAAGSTERTAFPEPWNQCVHRVFIKGCESCDAFQATFPELADSIKRDMKALAGTDTDVAKDGK